MAKKDEQKTMAIDIRAPAYKVIEFEIVGTAAFVANRFSQEAREMMRADMAAGSKGKVKKRGAERPPKDFDADYIGSMHVSEDGWHGIPATSFKAALVRAASQVGANMTLLKQCLFVEQDGFDQERVTPLVRITHGQPEKFEAYVRNKSGVADIRARARWAPGWRCMLRVRYDADLLSEQSIANMVLRAGLSVGVGAGRPASKDSVGMGWGTFTIVNDEAEAAE